MPLTCAQTEQPIANGEVLYAGAPHNKLNHPLSQEAINTIPETERSSSPCGSHDGSVSIWLAMANPGKPPNYLDLIKFQFSISRITAERYLPNLLSRYPSED